MSKQISRRQMLRLTAAGLVGVTGAAVLAACGTTAPAAQTGASGPQTVAVPKQLRFGVGPLQPTPDESKKAFEPFFSYLADQVGAEHTLVATTDWAGISVALANDQIDLAWMGPWGYVLANDTADAQAIATVKYDGKPIYHAIVVGRPSLNITTWPDDAKGLKISFADVGSTSGWLIPTNWFMKKGIDPKTYFQYSEGATHAANEIAVANEQTDLATDFDRNRNAMIEGGKLDANATKVVWTSDPLPNDAIAVRTGFDPALKQRIQQILVGITEEQAKAFMPKHYTGFIAATHTDYKLIEDAGIAVGRIKK